jgi:hypothetical protein
MSDLCHVFDEGQLHVIRKSFSSNSYPLSCYYLLDADNWQPRVELVNPFQCFCL